MQWPDVKLFRRQLAAPKIDMGDGRFVSAEDVLDGHFRRLAAPRPTDTVRVQIKPDLQAAIRVVAPDLAPLTALASEVADTVPHVQPGAQFRQDLHRALELSHRQQNAQRILGTRPHATKSDPKRILLLFAAIGFALSTLVLLLRTRQRTVSV